MCLKFTVLDAGYTATDYAIKILMHEKGCDWISATNADNIYGSEVIQNIRQEAQSPSQGPAEMILTPLDSRNIADQDYAARNEKKSWDQRCVGIEAMLQYNLLAYTVQPLPVVGRVDLAAVFLSASRLKSEYLFFGMHLLILSFYCTALLFEY